MEWTSKKSFQVVLTTLPAKDEPDLSEFLNWWLKQSKQVALARTGPERSLSFHYVSHFEGPWDTKPWGLREPPQTAPVWRPERETLCLVPGLAFSATPGEGAFRLGRGGGYYDRWLAEYRTHALALGIGFSVQTVESLPQEPHDQPLDGWWDGTTFRGLSELSASPGVSKRRR